MPPFVPGAPSSPGMDTRAAYGNTGSPAILRVLNTNDSGPNSFRAAAEATGDRVIIFETSGTATLQSDILISSPYCTIAGQTAPSPGFTLRRFGIQILTHDVAISHLRIRKGQVPGDIVCGNNIECYYQNSTINPYNIVIDHCSTSWGQDEGIIFYNPTRAINAVIWRSIMSEGLFFTPGSESCGGGGASGGHGLLVYAETTGVTVAQSLFFRNHERNPNMQGGTGTVLLNNIVFAWHAAEGFLVVNFDVGGGNGNPSQFSAIGNVFIPTAVSTDNGSTGAYAFWYSANGGSPAGNQFYKLDNTIVNNDGHVFDENNALSYNPVVGSPPSNAPLPVGYAPYASSIVESTVLPVVGARPGDRDTVDARVIGEVSARVDHAYVQFPSEVGGWGSAAQIPRPLTTPTNPHVIQTSGYSTLEEWLHGYSNIVEGSVPIMNVPNAAGTIVVSDTFTGVAGTTGVNHTPEIGGGYTVQTGSVDGLVLSNANRLRNNIGSSGTVLLATAAPLTSQFDIEIDFINLTLPSQHDYHVWARASAVAVTGLFAIYSQASSQWQLWRVIAGVYTLLGSATQALGASDRMRFLVRDDSLSIKINNIPLIYSTDNAITGIGRVGVGTYAGDGIADTNTTGVHLDRFIVTDITSGGVTLSGVSAFGALGTMTKDRSKAITGFGSTGAVGSVALGQTVVALTGVTATGFVGQFGDIQRSTPVTGIVTLGTLGITRANALVGLSATASLGSLSILQLGTVGLTGVSAASAVNSFLSLSRSKAISGVLGTTGLGTLSTAGQLVVALTGVVGTMQQGSVIIPSVGITIALTGVSATGVAEYVIPPIPQGHLLGEPIPNFLTIAGVEQQMLYGWTITDATNNTGTMRFTISSSLGTYIPRLDDQVVFIQNGVRAFAGSISAALTSGAGGEGYTPIQTDVTALDCNAIATRRFYYGTPDAPNGHLVGTLKIALQHLIPYLGVVLDPAQADGPTLDDTDYTGKKIFDILNDLSVRSGWVWEIDYYFVLRMYVPGAFAAPFSILSTSSLAIGDVTVEPTRKNFANRVLVAGTGVAAVAQDFPSMAQFGWWEFATTVNSTDQSAVTHLAAQILAQMLPTLKTVKYKTLTAGLKSGMTQTITLAGRGINNTYLITEVTTQYMRNQLSGYTVTAIEGLRFVQDWRETVRSWDKTATTSGGGTIVSGGGTGGGGTTVAPVRPMIQLGGSGIDATSSATAGSWSPVSGGAQTVGQGAHQPIINTVTRIGNDASITIRGRVLDAGTSFVCRLFDVTIGAECLNASGAPARSAAINTTTWTTVVFGLNLYPGSHLYELELQTSIVGSDAAVVGYLE